MSDSPQLPDSAAAGPRIEIEVCVGSVASAVIAQQGGANRIELNGGLALGGLTPSAGLVAEVRRSVTIPVIAMVRPRPGGFCYSPLEWVTLMGEADWLAAAGVEGLAFGVLQADRAIDRSRCEEFVRRFAGLDLVFHRAFDLVDDPVAALESLIDIGLTRVMTSGQAHAAIAGAALIKSLVARAAGRISVLPAGGIKPGNILALLQATGCREVHGTFSRSLTDPGYPAPGLPRFSPDDELRETCPDELAAVRRLCFPLSS